ncbi:MAG: polar amino acid transport system substrate-binding protein [Hyphomicrobiales bacterium]|jgi:polar amino acid transport system substrate-binding protein|nr:polar amino acid transport system substrate-binding protein [Hyphomicrobiales bacterium]
MTHIVRLLIVLVLLASGMANAQTADPRIADLVRAGKVRFGTFPPQYTKDARGELKGPFVEMMRAAAAHMGLPIELVELPTPAKLVECLDSGACDYGSLGFDPARADKVEGFTAPFMQFGYTFLVPPGSAIASFADADRAGVRIAVVRGHASTLAIGRVLQNAEQVSTDTPDESFDLLRGGKVDAWASAAPTLFDYAAEFPGSRVLADRYGVNRPTLVAPKGKPERFAYIREFIDHANASGLSQQVLDRAGVAGYTLPEKGKR